MKVGLISDTHGQLRAQALTHLAGVDLVLHAGDVGRGDILDELDALAPVHAVFGNTDSFELRSRAPERVELELEGWIVLLTHGHELGAPTAARLRAAYPAAHVIVYGHTHVARVEALDGALIVNPGAAGPARFRLEPSIAILELRSGTPPTPASVRLIPLR
ncbi:MAG TPA: metallophosphoesterase family protein [Longimicrobiales bacterium]|nr:metallophosphoesterase family protein [Longimicrobiales bacterium]